MRRLCIFLIWLVEVQAPHFCKTGAGAALVSSHVLLDTGRFEERQIGARGSREKSFLLKSCANPP